MQPRLRILNVLFLLCPFFVFSQSDGIVWANRILKSTGKFEHVDNDAKMGIGLPQVYQGVMNSEHVDAFTEGYILHYEQTTKRNIVKFGFPRPVGAEQLILGGIFNLGTIASIKVVDIDNKEIEVYQMTKGSVAKTHNFNVFFEPISVAAVKIEFDHSKINQWNLLHGVGLSESTQPIHPHPDIYTEDEFHGKEIVNLTHENNKGCLVFNAVISHDGQSLYFVKDCDSQHDQDIWLSEKDSAERWKTSKKALPPLNNDGHNFVASVGEKDKFLLLGNSYHTDGTNKGDGVSISRIGHDGQWGIPQNIHIPGLKNSNDLVSYYLSTDEKVMVMSIEDSVSIGGLDLYVSLYDSASKTWSPPKNMGTGINTFMTEYSPCLMRDNKTMFFSSTGYVGFGGMDIYITQRLDDSWQYWSKPLNLGPLVNTKTDEYGLSMTADLKHAYFNSINHNVDSAFGISVDIYRINLPKALYRNLEQKVVIFGKLRSVKDSLGNDAFITIKNDLGTIQSFYNSINQNGKYELSIPTCPEFYITVESPDFYKKEVKVSLNELNALNGKPLDLYLTPYPDSGSSVILKNIAFMKGSPMLSSISGITLDSLAEQLKINTKAVIEVGVHTDAKGDPKKNKQLTADRAKSVGNYLVSKGIKPDRVKVKGYGSDKPLYSNDTEEGRINNRRVSITFVGKLSTTPLSQ